MRNGKICRFLFCMLLLLCCLPVVAQKTGRQSFAMKYGEEVVYDLYFKWGVLMPRAGEAVFSYDRDRTVANAVSLYKMTFKTAKFFDGLFKMRDTISGYYNENNSLIFSSKNTDEGGYYAIDELRFNYGAEKTTIRSLRYTPSRVRIDTVLTAVGDVTDMLGVLFYMRGVNRQTLKPGDTFPLTVAIGRDLINIQFIYQNQTVVDRGNVKFNTRYFKIDIMDDAFESTKTSAEVWVGDDDNFLPIKVRSKLKIGYAEIYYKSASGLPHPLSCRIDLKK